MPRNYLLLTEIFPPRTGGSGRWFWDLYTRLDDAHVTVLTHAADDAAPLDRASGLEVVRTPMRSSSWGVLDRVGLRYYLRLSRLLARMIRRRPVSSIHCGRTIPEGVIGLAARLLTGAPYLCYVHGEDIEMCRSSRELTLLNRLVIRFADRIVCNSENSARLLRQWWNAREEQIAVLHPGVDAERFKPAAAAASSRSGGRTLLTVSRLQPRKGHDTLIRAMPAILAEYPDTRYVIIGTGPQRPYLESLIRDLGLENAVCLLGELDDAATVEWYQHSDLFVLPNRQIGNEAEGFGIVLLEAQACGTPVIGGDSGGTAETMVIGETGCIVDCTTPEPLAAAITALFSEPERLREMGCRARLHIERTFAWPAIMDRARSIFDAGTPNEAPN